MQLLTIEQGKEKETTHRIATKTRQFSAVKLAHISAGMLWGNNATTDATRPVWVAFAGGETELRPFIANMRKGKLAAVIDGTQSSYSRGKPTRFELLRSAGYSYTSRRVALPDGTNGETVIAALDDLIEVDPGLIAPEGIRFLALPDNHYDDCQHADEPRMLHEQPYYAIVVHYSCPSCCTRHPPPGAPFNNGCRWILGRRCDMLSIAEAV